MAQRGRHSSASLSVVSADGVTSVPRPAPPPDLTGEQAAEWRDVVDRLPADWFPRETHGLLAQYCRHVVSARRIADMIVAYEQAMSESGGEDFDVDHYDRLLKMQEREGRAMSSLATRMRISQQASFDKERKKGKPGKKPWASTAS